MSGELTVASLDETWAALERVLPMGASLRVFQPVATRGSGPTDWTIRAETQYAFGRGGASRYHRWQGEGSTFARAVADLVENLR